VTRSSWSDTAPLATEPPVSIADGATLSVARFGCRVISGPDGGLSREADGHEIGVGTAAGNELELSDRTVSSHHCAIRAEARGFRVVDLGSTNGVWVGGVRIESAFLHSGAVLRIGSSRVRFEVLPGQLREPLGSARRFGELHGASPAMRRVFDQLRRMAVVDSPALVFGPPGSGKSAAVQAIHRHSRRAAGPLVTVDCGRIPPDRVDPARIAAARGGTLVIEDLGELEPAGQEILLELLEAPDAPRLLATSSRDVRVDVNQGRLAPELYRRFHHARVRVPPLSERRDDVALLTCAFYRELSGEPSAEPPPELVARLERHVWTGTVRDLRAAVARSLLVRAERAAAGDTPS